MAALYSLDALSVEYILSISLFGNERDRRMMQAEEEGNWGGDGGRKVMFEGEDFQVNSTKRGETGSRKESGEGKYEWESPYGISQWKHHLHGSNVKSVYS